MPLNRYSCFSVLFYSGLSCGSVYLNIEGYSISHIVGFFYPFGFAVKSRFKRHKQKKVPYVFKYCVFDGLTPVNVAYNRYKPIIRF